MLPLPRLLWILLLIGALLRVGAIELRPARAMESSPDESQYLDIAHSLMHGQGFRLNGEPTAYRDPLYPILAAMVMWPFAGSSRPVLYLQVLLSCATALLFYRIGYRRFGSAAALLLAGIWLFYPGAILATSLFLTATLFMFLWVAALALYDRLEENGFRAQDVLLLGFCAGLTVLTRTIGLALVLAFVVHLSLMRYGVFHHTHWRTALGILVAAWIITVPWMVRNATTVGHFVLNTNGGFGLLAGESIANSAFPPEEMAASMPVMETVSASDSSRAQHTVPLPEVWWRKLTRVWATDASLWVRYFQRPESFIRSTSPLPVTAASLPGMLAVGFGAAGFILARRFASRRLLLLQLLFCSVALLVTYGIPRDHFPFMPALLMGVAALWRPLVWSNASLGRRIAVILTLCAVSATWLLEGLSVFRV